MEGKSGPVKGILAEQVGAKPLDGGVAAGSAIVSL